MVKKHMEEQKLTIRELAKRTGMKHPQIIRITNGTSNYNIDTLIKILDKVRLVIKIEKIEEK